MNNSKVSFNSGSNILEKGTYVIQIINGQSINFTFSQDFGYSLTIFGFVLISSGQNGTTNTGGGGGLTLQNNYTDQFITKDT